MGKEQPHGPELESTCSPHPAGSAQRCRECGAETGPGKELGLGGVWGTCCFLNANHLPSLKYPVQGLKPGHAVAPANGPPSGHGAPCRDWPTLSCVVGAGVQ